MPFLIFLLILSSCQAPEPQSLQEFSGHAMTMSFRVLTPTHNQDEKIESIILSTFEEIDAIYNKWNPQSELSLLNVNHTTEHIPISKELRILLQKTDQIVKLTEGRFDPTIEPIQKVWKLALSQGKEPSCESISMVQNAIGWHLVHFDDYSFWKEHPGVQIDLGGIAKGYGVDLIFERLQVAGFDPLFVEWGGEIRVSAQHPEGRDWMISMPNQKILPLSSQSIATSGDYEQNWTIQRKNNESITYFHIINPSTLMPLELKPGHLMSATIIAKTCCFADGIATAAFFFKSIDDLDSWASSLKQEYPDLSIYAYLRGND